MVSFRPHSCRSRPIGKRPTSRPLNFMRPAVDTFPARGQRAPCAAASGRPARRMPIGSAHASSHTLSSCPSPSRTHRSDALSLAADCGTGAIETEGRLWMLVGQIEELASDVPEVTLMAAARRIAMLATSGSAQQAEGELFPPVDWNTVGRWCCRAAQVCGMHASNGSSREAAPASVLGVCAHHARPPSAPCVAPLLGWSAALRPALREDMGDPSCPSPR